MGAVIAYDRPVVDFIDQLNATGHVTNTAYRKASVTFHHNGGRLSLQGCLDVWKVRPASAHFQSDAQGALGQYVKVNEYAWAAGNTQGNKESIHIEMANSTLAPKWEVAEVTWTSAARLAGWLFARVIGERPTRDNVHVHHDWKATICAGPYIDSVYEHLLNEVQAAYGYFMDAASPAPSPVPAPTPARRFLPLDQIARQVIAGSWSTGDDRKARLRAAGYDAAAVQAEVNRQLGAVPAPARKSVDAVVQEVIDGHWGNNPERSRKLQAAGYNVTEVQNAVNARLGGGSRPAVVRESIVTIADQVIRGQWGNGPERRRRITAAGYDYNAVQAAVNSKLR